MITYGEKVRAAWAQPSLQLRLPRLHLQHRMRSKLRNFINRCFHSQITQSNVEAKKAAKIKIQRILCYHSHSQIKGDLRRCTVGSFICDVAVSRSLGKSFIQAYLRPKKAHLQSHLGEIGFIYCCRRTLKRVTGLCHFRCSITFFSRFSSKHTLLHKHICFQMFRTYATW